MKANAPEKLYIENRKILYSCLTAYTNKRYDDDIEYTHTDAFIEKATKWLDETLRNTDFYENEIELMVEEFKKAMI